MTREKRGGTNLLPKPDPLITVKNLKEIKEQYLLCPDQHRVLPSYIFIYWHETLSSFIFLDVAVKHEVKTE